MWHIIGLSTFAGIGALLMMAVPLQTYISIISGKLRKKIAQLTDRRIQLMSEIIAGIQVLSIFSNPDISFRTNTFSSILVLFILFILLY